jgi:hypothetical protein
MKKFAIVLALFAIPFVASADEIVVTDVCPNIDEIQSEVPEGFTLVEGECVEDTAAEDAEEEEVVTRNRGGGYLAPCTYIIEAGYSCVDSEELRLNFLDPVFRDYVISLWRLKVFGY